MFWTFILTRIKTIQKYKIKYINYYKKMSIKNAQRTFIILIKYKMQHLYMKWTIILSQYWKISKINIIIKTRIGSNKCLVILINIDTI